MSLCYESMNANSAASFSEGYQKLNTFFFGSRSVPNWLSKDVDDPNRRALFSLVGAGVAVAGVNAALKASDETYAAFGTSEQMVQMLSYG